jgi:hypothetical protein
MKYALGNMLNGGIQGIDPNAKSYIDAIVAAGATVTSAQRNAVNVFYKTAKADGYYSQLKRFYLPIWGIAAPNAVDLITSTSGTFVGGITHGTGFIQGDGTTGYFNLGVSPQGVGMVAGSSSTFALVYQAQNAFNSLLATTPTSNKGQGIIRGSATIMQILAGLNAGVNITDNNGVGIYIESEIATNSRYLRRRTTSAGAVSLATNTTTPSGVYASFNINALCGQSTAGSRYGFSSAQTGGFGVGLAMTTTQADAFTLAYKTLWETCTNLVLP